MNKRDLDNPDLTALRNALNQFSAIQLAVVFGSVAKGNHRPDSDIDVAVQAERPLTPTERMEIIETVALACNRPVDLVDIRTAGQPLLDQIVSHGVQLIGTRYQWGNLIYQNIMDHEDFVPYQQRILEGRRQAWIKHS